MAELDQMRDRVRHVRCATSTTCNASGTDGAGDDQADAGSKTFEREQEQSIAANRVDLMTQIERAVERIDAGTYGSARAAASRSQGPAQGVPGGDALRRLQAARGAPLTDSARMAG